MFYADPATVFDPVTTGQIGAGDLVAKLIREILAADASLQALLTDPAGDLAIDLTDFTPPPGDETLPRLVIAPELADPEAGTGRRQEDQVTTRVALRVDPSTYRLQASGAAEALVWETMTLTPGVESVVRHAISVLQSAGDLVVTVGGEQVQCARSMQVSSISIEPVFTPLGGRVVFDFVVRVTHNVPINTLTQKIRTLEATL